ncbi:hypothetical protein D1872_275790 [compost metagenome]
MRRQGTAQTGQSKAARSFGGGTGTKPAGAFGEIARSGEIAIKCGGHVNGVYSGEFGSQRKNGGTRASVPALP